MFRAVDRVRSASRFFIGAIGLVGSLLSGCAGDMSVSKEVNSFATGDPFLAFTQGIHPYAVSTCAGCHSATSSNEGRRYPFATGPIGNPQSESGAFAAFMGIGLARFADRGSDGHGVAMPIGSAARLNFDQALQRYMMVLEGKPTK